MNALRAHRGAASLKPPLYFNAEFGNVLSPRPSWRGLIEAIESNTATAAASPSLRAHRGAASLKRKRVVDLFPQPRELFAPIVARPH